MPPDAANRNDLSMVDGTAAGPASRPQVSSAVTSNSRFCAAPGMHIDTIGTAIDLRCAQVSEIDQIFGKVGLAMKVDVNAPECLHGCWSECVIVQAIRHGLASPI